MHQGLSKATQSTKRHQAGQIPPLRGDMDWVRGGVEGLERRIAFFFLIVLKVECVTSPTI